MIIKWCRAESCICHDYKASAGQSGVGSQDRRLVRLPGAGGGMQNSSISSSTPFWWQVVGQRSLCYVARFGFGLMKVLNFYQLQAVAIMVTITVCKSNMVSGRWADFLRRWFWVIQQSSGFPEQIFCSAETIFRVMIKWFPRTSASL